MKQEQGFKKYDETKKIITNSFFLFGGVVLLVIAVIMYLAINHNLDNLIVTLFIGQSGFMMLLLGLNNYVNRKN